MELSENSSTASSETVGEEHLGYTQLKQRYNKVVGMCCRYLIKKLSERNCIGMLLYAHDYPQLPMLMKKSVQFIVANHQKAFTSDEFLELQADQLHRLLNLLQYRIQYRDIPVEDVKDAIWLWIGYNPKERQSNADILLS